jgi:hypothetical protein
VSYGMMKCDFEISVNIDRMSRDRVARVKTGLKNHVMNDGIESLTQWPNDEI